MELGAHVWLRSDASQWGWVPAVVTRKEDATINGIAVINLTLENDPYFEGSGGSNPASRTNSASDFGSFSSPAASISGGYRTRNGYSANDYYANQQPFEVVVTVDPEQLKTADHDDIKLRNLPASYQLSGEDPEAGVLTSPSTHVDDDVVGGVDDLIGLTHLHEPAILHALRLRYDADIIYTATGPILIAVNPFKPMPLYSDEMMEKYRRFGEGGTGSAGNKLVPSSSSSGYTPFNAARRSGAGAGGGGDGDGKRLPPHAYQTADDAYRAMMRGIENQRLMGRPQGRGIMRGESGIVTSSLESPTDQSILVSGESGAGKTVTTKIVLNYFAMLSKKISDQEERMRDSRTPQRLGSRRGADGSGNDLAQAVSPSEGDVSIEQQVLQSNPILESFGNARTIRNDNSSRFGKYIDIRFTPNGKLSGASIETYLLEKVRLIHPSAGERNYHVFYQFLSSATPSERDEFFVGDMRCEDFRLLSQTGTYDRRDGVSDEGNHHEMLDAMITIGFDPETIQSLMRLVMAVLHAGNMTFTPDHRDDSCVLDETYHSRAVAALLGVSFEGLSSALTSRVVNAGVEIIHKPLSMEQSVKAAEALIKSVYGAAFDYIVCRVNESIDDLHGDAPRGAGASIGVLDIFGFETFDTNNFEQICINYTNEALQQQFNKFVFKLEQKEYEKEGILWKFIAFPDNQDVLDLIDMKHTGVLALLDEQCIVPKSTDEKFTRYLYSRCDKHERFQASSAQRVDYKFSIEHYAGPVEYTTDGWLEKNKDQLPAASAQLLTSSTFDLIGDIRKYVRSEERGGRGTVATKSVGAQFSAQLKTLRARIDTTVPHYIRCLKPNDDLVPDRFEPKNIVEQLRCGGVLEAVRVSRAGYPTRYPHDVFMARYYILGDQTDTTPASPLRGRAFSSGKEAELKKLIAKIAFDVWEADHQRMMSLLEVERAKNAAITPKHAGKGGKAGGKSSMSNSLMWESSAMTPEEKRRREKDRMSLLPSTLREKHHTIARPESEEEFLSLDFPSRCAVAGLQLGRSKVFLRREAFDRIEALRSGVFFGAAALIQAHIRGKLCRDYFLEMRAASIRIQSVARMTICRNRVRRVRVTNAAVVIQSFWRMVSTRWSVYRCYQEMRNSACTIQRAYRMHRLRVMGRKDYDRAAAAATCVQAMVRGRNARESVATMVAAAGVASVAAATPVSQREPTPVKVEEPIIPAASREIIEANKVELYRHIQEENWAMVETLLDKNPELAEEVDETTGELPLHIIARHSNAWTLLVDMILVLYPKALIHRDRMGAMPIHHASAHDNLAALEIIYAAYKEGINDVDYKGRLPIHVAAEFDAVDAVKFLLGKSPEGAFTMVHRPPNNSGGGLPLHIACRNYASIGVITALLAENFASAKRADENGDLPLHLLLRCGEVVDQVVVKTLLTCFSSAVSRTDMNGDLPVAIALKHQCKPAVINTLLMQYPEAAGILNGDSHSPLFLAFEHNADDRTILGLLNHAPELATAVDKKSGLLPIQVATENEHSHFIVHNLLKRDMPIDMKEKIRAQLLPHHYSWNHIVANTDDMYYQVVTKVLQQCTQPQVLALAHVEGPDGKIALASATPVCKHEMRVMLRLFNTLEVVNQRPAYTNPVSDTQIFYALRYEPPAQQSGAFTILHEEPKGDGVNDYVEEWDDTSQVSAVSRSSIRSSLSTRSQQSVDDRLRRIKKEKGQQVIAKLTSRSDIVERELKVRKDHHLSRHYVPAIISVHHTVQHAAYSEAMAEPGYCITMEGADTTAENLLLDMRKSGRPFPAKALKRIGISLLHMHEHGLIHGDFGTHNIGKFGSRWKLLGVGGSTEIGQATDPNRGFYHPPESIVVESKRTPMGKKAISACVVSIPAQTTYDIWAYGVVCYEAIAGIPLPPYACRGKRAMSSTEVAKIGRWDERSLSKASKVMEDDPHAQDLVRRLIHYDPAKRINTMRDVLEHPFFSGVGSSASTPGASTTRSASASLPKNGNAAADSRLDPIGNGSASGSSDVRSSASASGSSSIGPAIIKQSFSGDEENRVNGVRRPSCKRDPVKPSKRDVDDSDAMSVRSTRSTASSKFKGLRKAMKSRMKHSMV